MSEKSRDIPLEKKKKEGVNGDVKGCRPAVVPAQPKCPLKLSQFAIQRFKGMKA